MLEQASSYMIANTLKYFINHFSPKLIPSSLYQRIVEQGEKKNNMNVDEVWKIIEDIPNPNKTVLLYFFTLLYKVSCVNTNMTIKNLCVCSVTNLVTPE